MTVSLEVSRPFASLDSAGRERGSDVKLKAGNSAFALNPVEAELVAETERPELVPATIKQ